MNIEATNTLEVLCIGESVTEISETVYHEAVTMKTDTTERDKVRVAMAEFAAVDARHAIAFLKHDFTDVGRSIAANVAECILFWHDERDGCAPVRDELRAGVFS